MRKIFGYKDSFAIEYGFIESDDLNDTYGYIKLWTNGIDLCQYNTKYQYEGNIYYLIEWFCEKIVYPCNA